MNLNLSASLNAFKLFKNPSLCLPHASVATFNDLPLPLTKVFPPRLDVPRPDIRAVVLDKDDCFAYPETSHVHKPYEDKFAALKAAFPGRRLLIVSNTAGALSHDPERRLADEVEAATGVKVLSHRTKKPGCGPEIMDYFQRYPETGVTLPSQIAVVGDRLTTDMMLANMMGSWGVWINRGVIPLEKKSFFSRYEHGLIFFLNSRGYTPPEPKSPFE